MMNKQRGEIETYIFHKFLQRVWIILKLLRME